MKNIISRCICWFVLSVIYIFLRRDFCRYILRNDMIRSLKPKEQRISIRCTLSPWDDVDSSINAMWMGVMIRSGVSSNGTYISCNSIITPLYHSFARQADVELLLWRNQVWFG